MNQLIPTLEMRRDEAARDPYRCFPDRELIDIMVNSLNTVKSNAHAVYHIEEECLRSFLVSKIG